jgi:N-acetylmuramic acid 6-phosphate etherase
MELDSLATEADSPVADLATLSTTELLAAMNALDAEVPLVVASCQHALCHLVDALAERMRAGGRLFYLGAGTSGRLGVVDASECPPTFGVAPDRVIGLIAGGDAAIRRAVEGAEDDPEAGWRELLALGANAQDTVVGLSASGRTPYVLGAVRSARAAGLLTGCIVCNAGSAIAAAVEHPIEAVVGPELLTGSTRLKAGTATKLLLNQLSTAVMIRLGYVHGNRMVDMQLANAKLVTRGTRYVMEATGLGAAAARELLLAQGSVRRAGMHGSQGAGRTRTARQTPPHSTQGRSAARRRRLRRSPATGRSSSATAA